MRVIVYSNEGPDQGYVYINRALDDDVARSLDLEIDDSDGYIPNCCGDLRVEFIEHEPNIVGERYQGSTHLWSGESFYFKRG